MGVKILFFNNKKYIMKEILAKMISEWMIIVKRMTGSTEH